MSLSTVVAYDVSPILARRGLGKLIEGLLNGDPVAWGITIVVVVVFVGIAIFKRASGTSDEIETPRCDSQSAPCPFVFCYCTSSRA